MKVNKAILLLSLFVLVAITSCVNPETKGYDTALSEIIIGKLYQTKQRIIESEYKYGRVREIFTLLDHIINDLKSNKSIVSSRKNIIDYINNIDTTYTHEFEKEAYRNIYNLRNNLIETKNSNVENLIYLNRFIDVIFMEEYLSILFHPKYQIQPFFNDTVFLSRGTKLELPLALYLEYEGELLSPNYIENNVNFISQSIVFNTVNRAEGEVYRKFVKMKVQDVVTGETYVIKDSITVKVMER